MAILHRVLRNFWVGLLAFVVGVPLVLFTLAKIAEGYLRSEHSVGSWNFRFHGAKISPLLSIRADSAEFRSPRDRIFLVAPTLGLLDWNHPFSRRAMIRLTVDSAEVRLAGNKQTTDQGPISFPSLRFLAPVSLEWRIASVHLPGGTAEVGKARWRSRGYQGLEGLFLGRWKEAGTLGEGLKWADFSLTTRWRGGNLRYRMEARYGLDSIRVAGTRDRGNLALGEDSLDAFLFDPGVWIPSRFASRLPRMSALRARGTIDWKGRYLFFAGSLRSGAYHFLDPCDWAFTLRSGARGGALALEGKSKRGSLGWEGEWEHPSAWLKKPDWNRCAARFSGNIRGFHWKLGHRVLPIEAEIPEMRLSPGLRAEGRVITRDSSTFDLHWNGGHPGRMEFDGLVSPGETWALIWTDTNVAYREGRVTGFWEKRGVQVMADLRGVRAYGAVADSVETDQEITSTGYHLRSARIYHRNDLFQGKGGVNWEPSGRRGVSLAFDLAHAEFGRVAFAMPNQDSFAVVVDGAHASRFPYRFLPGLSRFHPLLDGRFSWNFRRGRGETEMRAAFAYREKELRVRASADWTRDSLRLSAVDLVSGSSRLAGHGSLGLGGRSLEGLRGFNPAAIGFLRVEAARLGMGEILEMAGGSWVGADGILDGKLEYGAVPGFQGSLAITAMRIPALRGSMAVDGITLAGWGDSLRLSVRTSSTRHAILADTLEADLTGLRSPAPRLRVALRSGPFAARWDGALPGWKELSGDLTAVGAIPLGPKIGTLEGVILKGGMTAPLSRDFVPGLRFSSRILQLRYASSLDTQWLAGSVAYADGMLKAPDLRIRHSQGGEVKGRLEAGFRPASLSLNFEGPILTLAAGGRRIRVEHATGALRWEQGKNFNLSGQARSGSFQWPHASFRLEGGIENVRFDLVLPPPGPASLPRLAVRGRIHDFLFQHKVKIEIKDVLDFFPALKRKQGNPTAARRSRSWEMDLQLEAVGNRNRVNTDVLRLAFVGGLEMKGVYPYTLFRGALTGLQGEIGRPGQSYDVRDFEVKWENATLEEGSITVEGEKKIRSDCRSDTKSQCNLTIQIDGRLEEMNFAYDSDCGSEGESVSPVVFLGYMVQGCYTPPNLQGDEGLDVKRIAYKLGVEPGLNAGLTRQVRRASGGLIQSTQLTGLGAFVSGDSASYAEPVAVEVESKEKYRVKLRGLVGYHPEQKQANPMEYRLAAEYRPPLEHLIADSSWKALIRNRLTVETAVETRPPETREMGEERQVRQQVGLRYRFRFWDWW